MIVSQPLRIGSGVEGRKSTSLLCWNPDTMIFHRVNIAIEEVCPCFEPAVKHFILADTAEQKQTRTVVFAIFTSRFEFFGACHWTPTTRVWNILDLCGGESGWVIYHNNQKLRH